VASREKLKGKDGKRKRKQNRGRSSAMGNVEEQHSMDSEGIDEIFCDNDNVDIDMEEMMMGSAIKEDDMEEYDTIKL
jgi:hypothetical protein